MPSIADQAVNKPVMLVAHHTSIEQRSIQIVQTDTMYSERLMQ